MVFLSKKEYLYFPISPNKKPLVCIEMNGRQKVQEGIDRGFLSYMESRMLSTRNVRNETRKTHHSNGAQRTQLPWSLIKSFYHG